MPPETAGYPDARRPDDPASRGGARRGLLGALGIVLALSPIPARAQGPAPAAPAAAGDPRARFLPDDQWLLDALLSDAAQESAFEADGRRAAAGAPQDPDRFVLRWRQKAARLAEQYLAELQKDIRPDAASVEAMVSDFERAMTEYWLRRQPEARQKDVMGQIADGDAVIRLMRKTVEAKVRASRREHADTVARYLGSAPVREALAYREPPPLPPPAVAKAPPLAGSARAPAPSRGAAPPSPAAGAGSAPAAPPAPAAGPASAGGAGTALEQAGRIDAQTRAGESAPPEGAGAAADQGFSGGAVAPPAAAAPPGAPAAPPQVPALVAAEPGAGPGGFRVAAPPPPRDAPAPQKRSAFGVMARHALKTIAANAVGGIFGALLGFLLGGGILGLVVGAAAGAAVSYGVGRLLRGAEA